MKEEMESEKIEKKRIVSEYTERTSKLKGQCESLKYRVEEK